MITTVVFDLDDTLYNEIDYCRSGLKAAAEAAAAWPGQWPAAEIIYEALWRQFSCGNRRQTFDAAFAELGLPLSNPLLEKLICVYRGHRPDIELPASSKEVLDTLSAKYTLAMLTDGFLPAQRLKVETLGISHYFKSIVYTEELGRQFWKPAPEGFKLICSQLEARPQTSVYVGDNEVKDFIAPNRLGFVTIQLRRPASIHNQPGTGPDAPARLIIPDITALPALLETL